MLMITMPEAEEDFATTVTRESALPLKERLVAFRARHMDGGPHGGPQELPEVPRPARGRLGDLLWPLAKIRQLVAPEFESDFARLAQTFQRERQIVKGQSLEAAVLVALLALEKEVTRGVIPLKRVGALVNSGRSGRERVSPHRLGAVVRALGVPIRRASAGTVIVYSRAYVELLAKRHGIEQVGDMELELEGDKAARG